VTLTTCTSARAVQPGLNMTPGRQLLRGCHAPHDDAGADIARRPPGTPGMTTRSTTPSQRPEDALCAGAGPRRGGGEQIHAAKPTRRDASGGIILVTRGTMAVCTRSYTSENHGLHKTTVRITHTPSPYPCI